MLQKYNAATGEMDRMTQVNVAMVEESSAATRVLSQEAAERLTELVASCRMQAESDASRTDRVQTLRNMTLVARGRTKKARRPKGRPGLLLHPLARIRPCDVRP